MGKSALSKMPSILSLFDTKYSRIKMTTNIPPPPCPFPPNPATVECPWHVHISPFVKKELVENIMGGEDGNVYGHKMLGSPPPPSSTRMIHQLPSSPVVVYQSPQQRPMPIIRQSSASGGEQFEFIDGTTAGSGQQQQQQGDRSGGVDDVKRHHHPSSSSIPHQQSEPHRLIVGDMSSGDHHQTYENIANIIFGPFHRLSKPFFPSEFPQRRRTAKNVLFFLLLLSLLGRAIYYFVQLGKSTNLSLDWARASLQVSLTLNAVGALGWMHQNGGFRREFIGNLLSAIGQNQQPKCSMKRIVGAGVLSMFFLYTSALWALLRILELQQNDQVKAVNNGSLDFDFLKNNQQNSFSMESFYRISLTCLDAFLALLAGFISALGLGIFHLSFLSVLAEWTAFKSEQIDENIENARIIQADVMTRLSICASPLLRFAHFTSNKFEQLGTGMFMTAVFCNISATFIGGVTGIKESTGDTPAGQWPLFEVLGKVNNVNWSILSIMLLVITVKGPYDVHSKIREIKEQLLLEDALWNGTDKKLTFIAKNVVHRLGGIRVHRIGTQLFQLVFIAQMVLVWLLISGSSSSSKK